MKDLDARNYVTKAEEVIKELKFLPTTTQIRNLLAMNADIYNQVLNEGTETLSEDVIGRLNYLKLKMCYESGRNSEVKAFLEKSGLIEYVSESQSSKKDYLLFARYFEALIAYHKFYGGKD